MKPQSFHTNTSLLVAAIVVAFIYCLFLPTTTSMAQSPKFVGNLWGGWGMGSLTSSYWEPARNYSGWAVEWDFRKRAWPISMLVAFSTETMSENGIDLHAGPYTLDTTLTQYYLGARKYTDLGLFSAHGSIAAAWVNMDASVGAKAGDSIFTTSAAMPGMAADVGLHWKWGELVRIGIVGRYTHTFPQAGNNDHGSANNYVGRVGIGLKF